MMKKRKSQEEDIVFEQDFESEAPDFDKKVKKIKKELEKCKKEKEEYLDGWQRSKADFVNFKKRFEEEKSNLRKYANEDLVMSLIPTLDNFEAALRDHGESEEIKKWKIGFEHIYNQLKKSLESIGVKEMCPINEKFNPNEHEASEEVPTDDKKLDHTISEVVMKGYKMGEKILRAPQVKVWVAKE